MPNTFGRAARLLAQRLAGSGRAQRLFDTMNQYDDVLASVGGDAGEAFNRTEEMRTKGGGGVEVNRIAQGADVPATAALSVPYELLKALEQKTGLPALSGPGRLLKRAGVPVALPNERTSPASAGNVLASLYGAYRGLSR